MSALGPWEPADPNDPMCRRAAIKRGLVACGFLAEDDAHIGKWPAWAFGVYLALPGELELAGVRMLAEGSEEDRCAVEAAYALGGDQAVYAVVIRPLCAPSIRPRRVYGRAQPPGGDSMKIRTLKMSRKKTQDYQSRGAEVELELGPGDTYRDAVHAGNTLLAVALGETPAPESVERAKELLDRAREVQIVEASVAAPLPQAPKRRGRPPKSAQQPAGK